MKKLICILALTFFGAAAGCSSLASAVAGDEHNHWVVKNKGFFPGFGIMVWSSEVYYCPPDGGECQLATIEE